jgi:two-component system, chemotaxis family, protein-glutamate methylesterase/glutaminase
MALPGAARSSGARSSSTGERSWTQGIPPDGGTVTLVSDRLIVIGGSAGAWDPLREIVAGLSASLPATVLVTLHLAPGLSSRLPNLLDAAGPLNARHARHGEPLQAGCILVAPPDRHLVVHDGVMHLSRGPRENRHRPAVDALFNSAARWRGPDVIGVVLSGALDDGAAGAASIAAQDGIVIVQDPDDARITGMPLAAARAVRRARVSASRGIAPLLNELVIQPPASPERPEMDEFTRWESDNVDSTSVQSPAEIDRSPVALSCPDCNGGMFEAGATGRSPHYVCHVGHSWSPQTLMDAQRQASEASLYGAAAKLLEEATVLRRLAVVRGESGSRAESTQLEARAARAEHHARQVQAMLQGQ